MCFTSAQDMIWRYDFIIFERICFSNEKCISFRFIYTLVQFRHLYTITSAISTFLPHTFPRTNSVKFKASARSPVGRFCSRNSPIGSLGGSAMLRSQGINSIPRRSLISAAINWKWKINCCFLKRTFRKNKLSTAAYQECNKNNFADNT